MVILVTLGFFSISGQLIVQDNYLPNLLMPRCWYKNLCTVALLMLLSASKDVLGVVYWQWFHNSLQYIWTSVLTTRQVLLLTRTLVLPSRNWGIQRWKVVYSSDFFTHQSWKNTNNNIITCLDTVLVIVWYYCLWTIPISCYGHIKKIIIISGRPIH